MSISRIFTRYAEVKFEKYNKKLQQEKKGKPKDKAKRIKTQQTELQQNYTELKMACDAGLCYGQALVYAAHHHFGEREKWKLKLHAVANWDEESASLSNEIKLSDANSTVSDTQGHLIKHAMNDVIAAHAGSYQLFPSDINQRNLLDPEKITEEKTGQKKSYFEYIHKGVVHTIKQREVIAGQFSAELLLDILSEITMRKSIILVHNIGHTITLGWIKDDIWFVYNSWHNHQNLCDIEKTGTLKQCVDEILKVTEGVMALDFSSFKNNVSYKLDAFRYAHENNLPALLGGHGIIAACDFADTKLISWLKKASASSVMTDQIMDNCKQIFSQPWRNSYVLEAFISSDDKLLKIIFEMGKQSSYYETMRQDILSVLIKKDSLGVSIFKSFLLYSSENIVNLLEFLVINENSLCMALNLFNIIDETGKPLWKFLDKSVPQLKIPLINFFISKITGNFYDYSGIVSENQVFPKLLLHALVSKRPFVDLPQAMNMVFTHTPSLIHTIVNMLIEIPNGIELLIRHFDSRPSFAAKTWWQMLCENPVECMAVMLLLTRIPVKQLH